MGLIKTEKFSEQQNKIALFAKVFGHPARVSILQHLFMIDSCVCGEARQRIQSSNSRPFLHTSYSQSSTTCKIAYF